MEMREPSTRPPVLDGQGRNEALPTRLLPSHTLPIFTFPIFFSSFLLLWSNFELSAIRTAAATCMSAGRPHPGLPVYGPFVERYNTGPRSSFS